jgi:pullulanase
MNRIILTLFIATTLLMRAQTQPFDLSAYPVYEGNDLGLTYSANLSTFRIWSPTAEAAEVILYDRSLGGTALHRIVMEQGKSGTWQISMRGNQRGLYYAFRVRIKSKWSMEIPDPYVKLVGTNGRRGVIGDIRDTNPPGWEKDRSPAFGGGAPSPVDAVIYELHVRDASIHPSSGIKARGKFTGLMETGTRNNGGLSTGLDHLKEFGVTHVHLLPSYDYSSVDESRLDTPQYNWGYDPLNYNAPEGSYSSDPSDGLTRVKEFKQLVKAFHDHGLRVVMDVVYNHTMFSETSWFEQLVPGYYYRKKPDGSFSDASACGNETASERPMMQRFMIASLKHWVQEYHVDGFRFDLMGIHDIETMNLISRELHAIKPDILLYGEGWTAGSSPLPDSLRALKRNVAQLEKIAVFSDDIRDGIKGSVFVHEEKGFASGRPGMEQSIRFGITAATAHPQVDFSRVNYSKSPYAASPEQVISYSECHDNHILRDKLEISAPSASAQQRNDMQRLANAIVLTSQGIPFLHAGSEFLRTKKGIENSFNAGDSINAIDWDLKTRNRETYQFIRALVRMRAEHPAFRMRTAADIASHLRFQEDTTKGLIVYQLNGESVGDSWKKIMVVFNGSTTSKVINLPKVGAWHTHVWNNRISEGSIRSNTITINPYSASILYHK